MSCTTWWPLNLRSNAQFVKVLFYSLFEVSFGLWFRVSYTYLQYNSYSCGYVGWSICIGWVIHLMSHKSCVTVTPIIATLHLEFLGKHQVSWWKLFIDFSSASIPKIVTCVFTWHDYFLTWTVFWVSGVLFIEVVTPMKAIKFIRIISKDNGNMTYCNTHFMMLGYIIWKWGV